MPTYDQVAERAEAYARKGTNFTAVKDGVLKAGYCLKFSRSCAGADGGVYDAITAWRNAKHKHTVGTPPRGSFVFWEGSNNGHVAISAGAGDVWTTDFKRFGKVDRVSIKAISTKWRLRYAGWSEDINGIRATPAKLIAAPAPAPAAHADVRTYTVKRGDTLWDIAEKFYGDGQQWQKIAKASGLKEADDLAVGQRLRLP
jgi:hypothetical protein